MTFEELSTARYTQRSYDTKPVEDEKIQKILQAGRVAPTAKNNQPQKVYVVQSPAAMDKLRAVTPCHYNAPLAMIICYDKNQEWHNPTDETITSGVEDASIVATHMMLQAAAASMITTPSLRMTDRICFPRATSLPKTSASSSSSVHLSKQLIHIPFC